LVVILSSFITFIAHVKLLQTLFIEYYCNDFVILIKPQSKLLSGRTLCAFLASVFSLVIHGLLTWKQKRCGKTEIVVTFPQQWCCCLPC